jgi:UDP-N-acetylglucosamine 2-epimerase (non-hydrolysing)
MKKKILILVGTRPNFIKITRFKDVFPEDSFEIKIVHTGQHFDSNMADIFFKELNIYPDYFLNINPASPNTQIAEIISKMEELINKEFYPDLIIVPGDVNSTLAGAITANKMGIKLAHLEAGLRSFDRTMPEEINRIIVDEISDYCFVTEPSGLKNLKLENKTSTIFNVGNTMIDTIVKFSSEIDKSNIVTRLNIIDPYVLITIHRPANVDNEEGLLKIIELLNYLSLKYNIVFPIHPRTLNKLKDLNLFAEFSKIKGLVLTDPLGYFDFQKLIKSSQFVLTDSGGIQEETTFYQKPCLTLRKNTERPITCEIGTNKLVDFDVDKLKHEIQLISTGEFKKGKIPEYWDGFATERIYDAIKERILN